MKDEPIAADHAAAERERVLVYAANDVLAWFYRVKGCEPGGHTVFGRLKQAIATIKEKTDARPSNIS